MLGRLLWSCGHGVLEFLEDGLYVAWHGHITCASFVFPFEGEAEVESAAPLRGDLVEAGEGGIQVLGVRLVDVLDTVVVHYKAKADVLGLVVSQPRHVLYV